jgi:hypothetical protein
MIEAAAYSQVSFIISKMSYDLQSRIPKEIRGLIESKKDKNLVIEAENVNDLQLLKDTEKMLSVLYTDYLATEEERKIIRGKERILAARKEEQKKLEYNNVDMFKHNEPEAPKEEITPMIQYKQPWYKRIANFFKNIF